MPVPYYDWISHHASHRPKHIAAVDLGSGRHLTWRDFDQRIARVAGYLGGECGIAQGDRVAVLAQNTTDTFEIQFACFRLGAIFVPLNWRLAVPELCAILDDCAPCVLIHDTELAATIADLAKHFPSLSLCTRGAPGDAYECSATDARPLPQPVRVTHDDVAVLLYTSGTTGRPKGVVHTYGTIFWVATNFAVCGSMSSSSIGLCALPLFHIGGLGMANTLLHGGSKVVLMRGFDPAEAVRLIGDPSQGITHFFGVPAHYQFMAQQPGFNTADFSHLKMAAVGAAPVPITLLDVWMQRSVLLRQAYGMTENGAVLMLEQEDAVRKAGSTGKPVLHAEVRIVRPDGKDAAPAEIAELWVRGPNVTPGYWNQPDITRASFTDGWLHTGDAAYIDGEGFYFIVDRWKDMYISGGENVYPAEVENILYQLPAVSEAAVIGVPDPKWGEVGRAVIVLKPNHHLGEAEILAHCTANLARYKVPRSVVFTDVLPRTASGKVHKPTLRQSFV